MLPMYVLSELPATSVDDLWIYALIGIVGGLVLSYQGFRLLQRKRLILNTPTSKVRSASLGLVEVSGLAVGPYTIPAPVTRKPCFYYRTLVWELRKSGKNEQWKQVVDESLHVPFFLDDNTGQVLVNPQGADLDLHRDFHEQYSNSILFGQEMPDSVRSFLARHGVSGDHKVRVDEYCIKPKNALFILGTLSENPGLQPTPIPIATQHGSGATFAFKLPGSTVAFTNLVSRGESAGTPGLHVTTHQEVIRLSPTAAPSTQSSQQSRVAAALMKAGITNPAAWAAAGINDPVTAMQGAGPQSPSAAATAPAPDSANPAFDLHPKIVLMKGENDPTFLISWRSQRELVSSLGWKATACIWGGPALTLLGVYVIALKVGWL